jgi:galactofuranose transport system permease protein
MTAKLAPQYLPLVFTSAVCLFAYGAGCIAFPGFFSVGVLINFFTDNSFLGVAAIGLTFVILSGGIDLSVGAVIGCVSILAATLIERAHVPPALAMPVVLALGTLFGVGMGCLICIFELPPFLVTLAGLFFCRGLGLLVSSESVAITHPVFISLSGWSLPIGPGATIPLPGLIFLAVLLAAVFVSLSTRFGRNVYAVGGNEQSAMLMGLPVSRTKIGVYALSGFCSALAGVVYTLYTSSGNAVAGTGLELDAIAAVVVGGTLLSGGVGYVAGTLVGVLIFGIIQTSITFQGTLSSWWTKIAIGALLLCFIILQKIIHARRRTPK